MPSLPSAPTDLRLALPRRTYGLQITVYVGEQHLHRGVSLLQIQRDLNARGIPVDQRHTGRIFRDFLALVALARGDDAAVQQRLRAQGGIVLMCDGVQFEDRSPVLYLLWDAVSGTPLFGERKVFRGEDDLVPMLDKVKAMNVPVLGIVTDKERGLVPALQSVFPDVPYQFCHTHFLKNVAKPLQTDLTALQASVRRRADAVRAIARALCPPDTAPAAICGTADDGPPTTLAEARPETSAVVSTAPPTTTPDTPPTAADLAREVCELVRVNSRVGGKAPLDPPELERHQRLEKVRALVNDAREKKAQDPPTRPATRGSTRSRPRST